MMFLLHNRISFEFVRSAYTLVCAKWRGVFDRIFFDIFLLSGLIKVANVLVKENYNCTVMIHHTIMTSHVDFSYDSSF